MSKLVFQRKDLWIRLWVECMDDSDNANDILNSVRVRASAKVMRETLHNDVAGYASTKNNFKHFGERFFSSHIFLCGTFWALCLRTKWTNPCDSFFGTVTCVATKETSLHLCNNMGAELFVDGRLNSCPSNLVMIPAWCVKIAKIQQPSLEQCATKVKFPFSGHKNADEHT